MWAKAMKTLLQKDLRLHGWAIALTIAGALLLIALAQRLAPPAAGARMSFVFTMNLLLTLLWSDWLITRERSKGTFAWLRALPVDDAAVAGSKFAAAAGCCAVFWTTSSALFARELWRPPGTWLALLAALLTFGGLSIATKWRFPWRLGHVLPLVIVLVPMLLFMTLADDGTALREHLVMLWNAPYGRLAASTALLGLYGAIIAVTIRWVRRADTFQLVD